MTEAEAFEKAIREKPDEMAGYAAYADWLQEHDDPRGEFMQVQLALENEELPKEEREKLKAREAELLKAHEREWLGELAPHIFNRIDLAAAQADPNYDWDKHDWNQPQRPKIEHTWRRGFVMELKAECLTVALAQTLVDTTSLPCLQKLHVTNTADYLGMQQNQPPQRVTPTRDYHGNAEWLELFAAPCLGALRVFQMGNEEPPEDGWCDCHCYAAGLEHLISGMIQIEELTLLCKGYDLKRVFGLSNLTNLRVLRIYAWGYPYGSRDDERIYILQKLAANPAVRNLTHLLLHPHGFGHESFIPLSQVRHLLTSPHLRSLTHLQLRLTDMGDEGVREIIASGILKRLKWLDLRHGCITDEGAKLFAECPDAKNLERLDLSRNAVSAEGLKLLRKAKINAVANRPLTQQELAERQYLREGDFE